MPRKEENYSNLSLDSETVQAIDGVAQDIQPEVGVLLKRPATIKYLIAFYNKHKDGKNENSNEQS